MPSLRLGEPERIDNWPRITIECETKKINMLLQLEPCFPNHCLTKCYLINQIRQPRPPLSTIRIDSLRSALQKQKRITNSTPNTDSTVTRKSAFARSAPSETVQRVEKTIEDLQQIVKLFNSNKKKRDYTCLQL